MVQKAIGVIKYLVSAPEIKLADLDIGFSIAMYVCVCVCVCVYKTFHRVSLSLST